MVKDRAILTMANQ